MEDIAKSIALDGVYVCGAKPPRFQRFRAPDKSEL